jgi:signal transduction histidine kinase
MLHVLGCITEQHDFRLVLLAAVLCLFASATAMTMIARGRAASGSARTAWLVAAGVAAGCGIWGLHFVAMLAYRTGLPVSYDAPLTGLSILIAVSLCALGFYVGLSRAGGAVGGAITGMAISAMHYVGMAAVRMPAHSHWTTSYVVASIVVGVLASSAALLVAVRRHDLKGYVIAAGLFAFGIVGMHFTAMSAVVFVPDPAVPVSGVIIAPGAVAAAVAASVILIMGLGMIGAVVDHHLAHRAIGEAARLRSHIAELETTKRQLECTTTHLKNALAAADAANDAKARFLAAVSHELRTPLNAVIGFADLLRMETCGPLGNARYLEYANDIQAGGVRLLGLVNEILEATQIGSMQASLCEEVVDVGAKIERLIHIMLPDAVKAGVGLDWGIEPKLPRLRADHQKFWQVLINLVSNAIKFTPAGGNVRVLAEARDNGMVISVNDTGIGISPDDIPKVFERFWQADEGFSRKYEGVGLGLAIARDLVEQHGGRLSLESRPGAGTTATIYFPVSRLVSDASSPEPALCASSTGISLPAHAA